jgi:TP901 family phage tail tape measure protein
MADFVATIRLQIDIPAAPSGAAGGGGTGGGAAPARGSIDLSSLRELQQEFSRLASQVRAVTSGLEQIRTATGNIPVGGPSVAAPGGTGAPGTPIEVGRAAEASERHADAAKEDSKETKRAAEASEEKAEAVDKEAVSTKKAAEAAEEMSGAAKILGEMLGKADEDINSASKDMERAFENIISAEQEAAKKLGPASTFKILGNIADNPEFRKRAASAQTALTDAFKVPPGATAGTRASADKLRKQIQSQIDSALSSVRAGDFSRDVGQKLLRNIRTFVTQFNDTVQDSERVTVDTGEIASRVLANQFTTLSDTIIGQAQAMGKSIRSGAEAIDVAGLRSKLEGFIATLEQFAGQNFRKLFGDIRGGAELFTGAPALGRRVAEAVPVRERPVRLTGVQATAARGLREAASAVADVTPTVQAFFRDLALGSTTVEQFRRNIREVLDVLKVDRTDFPDESQFLAFQEFVREIKRGVTPDLTGGIGVRPGAVAPETLQRVSGLRLQEVRRTVAAGGRGARGAEVLQFADASGNVKKIRVELEQLGTTLKTVRTRARAVSDNMFDRTSVRAALQRVATWGAAAGIVFGAVNAFRNALNTVTSTESAVVGLAKVMEESTADFETFKRNATETAISIAQDFGQPLDEVLETLTLFGQQGLNLRQAQDLSRAAALAANVTTLTQPQAASALTATIKQFGVNTSEAIAIIDKFNQVSNRAAVTEDVLAEALKRAGLAARNAGITLDEFNGIVAAISEQTRQTGSEIGTALRFVFSRLNTEVAEQGLAAVGISLRDASGNVRPFLDVIKDLSDSFDDLSSAQRNQVAISLAGTRRFNTLLALINNFEQAQKSTRDSVTSANSAFREQARQEDTLRFKLQQLKNSFSGLSISIGNAFIDPVKDAVEISKVFVDTIASVPSGITALVASVGLGTAIFARFADTVSDTINFVGSFGGLTSNLARSLKLGRTEAQLREAFGASFDVVREFEPGLIAARAAPDFAAIFGRGRKDVSSFADVLKAANRELVDQRGNVVKNAQQFSKFGATIRGFSTRSVGKLGDAADVTALSILGLNSGFSRLFAVLGKISSLTLRLVPGLTTVFGALDRTAARAGNSVALAGLSIARFAAAAGIIFGIVVALGKLKDAVTETGESVKDQLEPEIAKRQEVIDNIRKQRDSLEDLSREQARLARQDVSGLGIGELTPGRLNEISRRGVPTPLLSRISLSERQAEAARTVGLANPQLIDSIDSLGNVTLRSAAAFDALGESAKSAQESLQDIRRLNIIEAFSRDLLPSTGFRGVVAELAGALPLDFIRDPVFRAVETAGGVLEEDIERLQDLRRESVSQLARGLNVDIRLIDPSQAEDFDKASKRVLDTFTRTENVVASLREQFSSLTRDASIGIFSRLARGDIGAALGIEARRLTAAQGRQVTREDIVNQLFLRNRAAIGEAQGLVGLTPLETVERFRRQGIAEQVRNLATDFERTVGELTGGEFVLFDDVRGIPRQAIVRLDAAGRRQLQFFAEEAGGVVTKTFEQILSQGIENVVVLNVDRALQQINQFRLELGRVPTGAGRGGILRQDVDLGARFRSDVAAQQRIAQVDERAISDLLNAEQSFNRFIEAAGLDVKNLGEATDSLVDPKTVQEFEKFRLALDISATALRFRTEIEEVSIAFEKAARDIRDSDIRSVLEAEFSGRFGARAGLVRRGFEAPIAPGGLRGEERLQSLLGNEFTRLANILSKTEEAIRDALVGQAVARENISEIARDFQTSLAAGGIRDPRRISSLAAQAAERVAGGGFNEAQAILASLSEEQISNQQKQIDILQVIADKGIEEEQLGAVLRSATEQAFSSRSTEAAFAPIVSRLEALSPEQVARFRPSDVEAIAARLPQTQIPENLRQTLQQIRGGRAISDITTRLITGEVGVARRAGGVGRLTPGAAAEQLGGIIGDVFKAERLRREQDVRASEVLDLAFQRTATLLQSSLERQLTDLGVTFRQGEPVDLSGITEAQVRAFRQTLPEIFRRSFTPVIGEVGIAEDFEDQLDDTITKFKELPLDTVRQLLENFANSLLVVPRAIETAVIPAAEGGSGVGGVLASAEAQKQLSQAISQTIRNFAALNGPLSAFVSNVLLTARSLSDLSSEITTSTITALDQLAIESATSRFRAPQIGLLRGVNVPQVDLGVGVRGELTAQQLTALENPALSDNLTAADAVFSNLVDSLTKIREEEQSQLRLRSELVRAGNVAGVRLVDEALQGLGARALFVEAQLNKTSNTFRNLGESFRELERVNDFRLNIERLIETFERDVALEFDRTSIETAVGQTPFSFIRPTFEQFERGQRGFLTRFERAIEDVRFRVRGGEISPVEGRRQVREAEFQRDEALIQFAQRRETAGFQREVRTAEQVREQLFDFARGGGPGSAEAQQLFRQLTRELESAGDVLRTSLGARTIRDPRTGRDVSVPSSQVLRFRGVQSLGGIAERAQRIAERGLNNTATS